MVPKAIKTINQFKNQGTNKEYGIKASPFLQPINNRKAGTDIQDNKCRFQKVFKKLGRKEQTPEYDKAKGDQEGFETVFQD